MSQNQIGVTFTRGGRTIGHRSFSLGETQQATLGHAVEEVGLTAGLGSEREIYVRHLEDEREISAHGMESRSLESVLRGATADGELTGTFVIDCTAEHKGAPHRGD
jgi:hypothetical protein